MSTADSTHFEELAVGNALGALSETDALAFQKMLASASTEQRILKSEIDAVVAEIAVGLEEEPSQDIRESVLQMARESIAESSSITKSTSGQFRFAIAASVTFFIASIALYLNNQTLTESVNEQQTVIQNQESKIQSLETEIDRKEALLTILEARDVDLILMDGLEVNPDGYGKVVWDKENGRALLQVANLPAVATTNDYQLWFIINNQPISAGVFAVQDPSQDDFFAIEDLGSNGETGAFAISLEPKGGSPQPTGDIYMLGAMN